MKPARDLLASSSAICRHLLHRILSVVVSRPVPDGPDHGTGKLANECIVGEG